MSNLDKAKSAIEAELSQAKQGLAYYQSHVAALENTLAQLGSIAGGTVSAKPAGAKRGRKPGQLAKPIKLVKAGRGRPPKAGKVVKAKTGRAAKGPKDLPFTGGDYWPNLVTSNPQSASEILQASISGLSFTPTPEQVKKLTQRMTFVLNALVKSGRIKDSGSGRGRRFFQ